MNKFRVVLAVMAALLLSACYPPVTRSPVGTTAAQTPDPVLLGTWKGNSSDGKPSYFHFLLQRGGTITAIIVESGPKAEDWNYVTLTTAALGANRFMNARMLLSNGIPEGGDPAVQPNGTVPVLYRIDAKGVLTLSMMDEAATKAAIRAGKIKGTIEKGDMGDAVITAAPAALDKFLQTPAGLALFANPFFTLKKVE
ncbi:MAG TPA: hypothetical protein VII56_09630 [Rhizomicrobium sp.]